MEAGLKEGDVIVAINGNTTTSTGQLQEAMAKLRPGDKAKVTFYRDNKKETVTVTLRNNQGTTNVTKAGTVTDLGCAFKAISPETRRQLGISSGVQVSGLQDGRFRRAGIKEGFIITDINNSRVASADDVEKMTDVNDVARRKARYAKAGVLTRQGREADAMKLYTLLSAEVKSAEGAEARYRLIEAEFKAGNNDKAEKMVYELSDSKTPAKLLARQGVHSVGRHIHESRRRISGARTYQSVATDIRPRTTA